ncbi:gag-Pol polyprotein [Trichonephila clavipes]|uniref:Gag-Pol polyprotein n=1 Tax=Trichonephila clavipes TaxID=2585209 RepID=A0A8X6VU92_TRICX|nr:gag-Pol polyprotein [Trichonephila clavipes]
MRSSIYAELIRMLGTEQIKTTAYLSISNGTVKHLHRDLKSALKVHESDTWSEIVPIILLGIRTAAKKDVQSSCAKIVYSTNLRLPNDMTDRVGCEISQFMTPKIPQEDSLKNSVKPRHFSVTEGIHCGKPDHGSRIEYGNPKE